jgi:hypothetical protein
VTAPLAVSHQIMYPSHQRVVVVLLLVLVLLL